MSKQFIIIIVIMFSILFFVGCGTMREDGTMREEEMKSYALTTTEIEGLELYGPLGTLKKEQALLKSELQDLKRVHDESSRSIINYLKALEGNEADERAVALNSSKLQLLETSKEKKSPDTYDYTSYTYDSVGNKIQSLIPVGNINFSSTPQTTSERVKEAYEQYQLDVISRNREILEEKKCLVQWSNRYDFLSFLIIHIIMLTALYFSIREFATSNKLRRLGKEAKSQDIEVAYNKITVKTTLHGIILLCGAIVLYYLYLKYIYPVQLI